MFDEPIGHLKERNQWHLSRGGEMSSQMSFMLQDENAIVEQRSGWAFPRQGCANCSWRNPSGVNSRDRDCYPLMTAMGRSLMHFSLIPTEWPVKGKDNFRILWLGTRRNKCGYNKSTTLRCSESASKTSTVTEEKPEDPDCVFARGHDSPPLNSPSSYGVWQQR